MLDVIARNAKRLRLLTEDILDVTRIETKTLKLNKERFQPQRRDQGSSTRISE